MSEAELVEFFRARSEWNQFRTRTREALQNAVAPESAGLRINKVESIGKFVAKLKKPTTYTPAILEEMNKFNLKNFRDDLANAIIEAVASKFDLHLTIRILTSIWTTYNDDEYRAGIFGSLEKLLSDKKTDQIKGLVIESKVQVYRLFFELFMMGFPITLKTLIASFFKSIKTEKDVDVLASLPLINMFVEHLAEPFLNLKSKTIESLQEKHPAIDYRDCFEEKFYLREEQKKYVNVQISTFMKYLEATLKSVSTEKARQEEEIHEIYKRGSEMPVEKKEKYEQISSVYESLLSTGLTVRDFYNHEFTIQDKDETQQESTILNFIKNTTNTYTKEQLISFYEDEEEAALYLDLLDPDLIKESASSGLILETTDDKKMNYKQFSECLKECTGYDAADRLTIKFSEINNSRTRKMLVQDITDFRTDYHLVIKYICRILANLDQKYSQEIRKYLTTKLQSDYETFKSRSTTNRPVNYFFDNRVRNMNFIIEFTKYRLILPNFIIGLVNKSIDEFEHIDKQVIVRFLETCGRFLRKYQESTERFTYLIEVLSKKVKTSKGSEGTNKQIESCIHYCMLDKKKIEPSVPPLTDLQKFVQFLAFQLAADSWESYLSDFLKLPWRDSMREIQEVILDSILLIRLEQIHLLARLISHVACYYPSVKTYIKDVVFEIIMNGVTDGYLYTEKQTIITYTIFAALLRNEKVVEPEEALMLLFFLIDYSAKERKFKVSTNDDVNDNFRVCVVVEFLNNLETDKLSDTRGKVFLVMFMLYVLSKNYISSQLEYKVIDCLKRMNPNLTLVDRKDSEKLAQIFQMMEEKDHRRLEANLKDLESSRYQAQGGFRQSREEEANASKINQKFEEIMVKRRNGNNLKMEEDFAFELMQMADKDLGDCIKNTAHSLSSTNVNEVRKKNESKNLTGSKLLIRNKNKYQSAILICNPLKRDLPRPGDEDSEGEEESEQEDPVEEYDGEEEKSEESEDIGKEFYEDTD